MSSREQSDLKDDEDNKSTVKIFHEVGYLFEPIEEIGKKVTKLFDESRAAKVDFRYFEQDLQQHESINALLACYPKVTKFHYLWGTGPDFICWDNPSAPKPGIIMYLIGEGSKFECLEGSHRRKFDRECGDDSAIHLSDEDANSFSKKKFDIVKGGVLVVDPILGLRMEDNRSIIFGLKK